MGLCYANQRPADCRNQHVEWTPMLLPRSSENHLFRWSETRAKRAKQSVDDSIPINGSSNAIPKANPKWRQIRLPKRKQIYLHFSFKFASSTICITNALTFWQNALEKTQIFFSYFSFSCSSSVRHRIIHMAITVVMLTKRRRKNKFKYVRKMLIVFFPCSPCSCVAASVSGPC